MYKLVIVDSMDHVGEIDHDTCQITLLRQHFRLMVQVLLHEVIHMWQSINNNEKFDATNERHIQELSTLQATYLLLLETIICFENQETIKE